MEVILLSSDSEEDGSDVEIIAQYCNFLSRAQPLPQQGGEGCAGAPNLNAPTVRLGDAPADGLVASPGGCRPSSRLYRMRVATRLT